MAFIRQTWTLCEKTLTIVFLRHWLGLVVRAFLAPIIFIFIISYAKNFFVPPSDFGVGSPGPIPSFEDALRSSSRSTVAFVNNNFTSGEIATVIDQLAQTAKTNGKHVEMLQSDEQLVSVCKSSVRGVSDCFGALSFHSSPSQGSQPVWNYTLYLDGSLGTNIYVDSNSNDVQMYVLPFQVAVDNAIAGMNGSSLPTNIQQYPYTSQTGKQRSRNINHLYMGSIINILGVAYFIGIVGICYQLTGEMAKERELGMSPLIEAMMPNRRRWEPQVARLIAMHVAFDILYLPSWIIMGAIVAGLNYSLSNYGIPIGFFIMAGFALSSWSVGFASLFSRAQLSGITVVLVSIILAIIVQVIPPLSTGAAVVLSLIFPPMNFVLFIIYCAYWQQSHQAIDLSQAAPNATWQFPGYVFFIFCIIQIIVYPIVGALIERGLYGTASKSRVLRYGENSLPDTVKIAGLSKHYPPGWWSRKISSRFTKNPKQTVVAVDNIDLTVLRGQIVVLLGANGSGKTTTMDMLAGLQVPTNGHVEVEAEGGIGLCPQKNVLWDELTVYEHVKIFNRLKAQAADSKQTLTDLVLACDLEQKMHSCSGNLSGGQKRKVQLAMMLTGGSSVCMVDEVSSGLDPLSRRKIWDILLAERGRRSILMTTHFLDEADLLSDDITIMSKGQVVANDSAVLLKHRLGSGYRVGVYHEDAKTLPSKLDDTPKTRSPDQTVYSLADSATASLFINELEKHGVQNYQVNGPTIEDVFLKLASEVVDEQKEARTPSPNSSEPEAARDTVKLTTGKNLSFWAQTLVLFRKRITILWRNPWPYWAALLIPIIAAGLVTLFLQNFVALSCTPNAANTPKVSDRLDGGLSFGADILRGPPAQVPTTLLNTLFPPLMGKYSSVSSLAEFNNYIRANFSDVTPGGFFLGNTPTIAWQGNYGLEYAVAAQNLLDTSLLGTPISAGFQPFTVPWDPSTGDSLQFILYFGLAMSAYPAFFALYTTLERLRNVRALHYSNGVRAGPLWLAYTLFDFIIVLLVAAISIIIFTGASDIFYSPGRLFVVFVFYGLSATLMSYCISLFTSSQLATFAFAAGAQCVMFLLYFIAYLCITTYAKPADIDNFVSIANYTIALFFPAGNLLRALLLTFNEFSLLCRGDRLAPNPGAINVYGAPILYSILQSIVFIIILVWYDSGYVPPFLSRKQRRIPDLEETEDVDAEVFGEAKRVHDSNDELRALHLTKVFGTNLAVSDVTFGVPRGTTLALLGPNGAGKSTVAGLIRGDMRPTDRQSEVLIEDTSILKHRATARQFLGVCPQFDAMDSMTAQEHLRFYARVRGVPDVEHNVEQVIQAVGLTPFKTRMASALSGGNKRKLSLGISLMGNPSVLLLDEPSSGMDAASKRIMWQTLGSVSSDRSLVLTTHSMEEADALADRAAIMARRMLAIGTVDLLRKKHGDAFYVHIVHKNAPHTSQEDMDKMTSFIRQTFPGAAMEERTFHGQVRFSVPNTRFALRAMSDARKESSETDEKTDGTTTQVIPASDAHEKSSAGGISALFAQLEANKEALGFEFYSISQTTLDQVFLSIVGKHNVLEENYAREHPKKTSRWMKFKQTLGGDTWRVLFKF